MLYFWSAVFVVVLFIFVWDEVVNGKNVALAIVLGCVVLAIPLFCIAYVLSSLAPATTAK